MRELVVALGSQSEILPSAETYPVSENVVVPYKVRQTAMHNNDKNTIATVKKICRCTAFMLSTSPAVCMLILRLSSEIKLLSPARPSDTSAVSKVCSS